MSRAAAAKGKAGDGAWAERESKRDRMGRTRSLSRAGGGVVEGYPHEKPTKKVSASFLYNATRPVYERMGFEYVRPKGLKNCVMRIVVTPR